MDMISEGSSESTTSSDQKREVHYLSGEWINARMDRVREKVRTLLIQRIIDEGLLSSGYKPFQSPITDELLMKMTPEQAQMLIDSLPSIQAKAAILERLKALKVPRLKYLAPASVPMTHFPSQETFDASLRTRNPISGSE